MRTILAFSGVTLAVLVALLGRGLVEHTPSPKTSPPATAPPRAASVVHRGPPSTPSTPEAPSPREPETVPNAKIYAAIDAGGPDQKAHVIGALENSGRSDPRFAEQARAFGSRLNASGLVSDYRCFAAGCYFVVTKPVEPEDTRLLLRERDAHVPSAVLVITHEAPPNKLVVLINTNMENS